MQNKQTHVLSVPISAPAATVIAKLTDPFAYPVWATEFFAGEVVPGAGGNYKATVPMMGGLIDFGLNVDSSTGKFELFFSPEGAPFGEPVLVRVLSKGSGAEVQWTLDRQPGMPEQAWIGGIEAMERELGNLKKLIEG